MISAAFSELRQKIEYLPVASLKPDPLNPRLHPASQIKALARAIAKFGFLGQILVDDENTIIAGHGRVEAAKSIGMTDVPTVRVSHLTPGERRAFMLADNKLGEMSNFSEDLLIENFNLLQLEPDVFDLELTGFSVGEIDVLLDQPAAPDAADPDDALTDTKPVSPISQLGDLWQLGAHRLACGSALEADTWTKLMNGEKAVMSISDVPYNVPIAGHVSGLGKIRHGDFVMASGELDSSGFQSFLETSFHHLAKNSVSGSMHYTFIDWRSLGEMQAAGNAAFTELKNMVVWDKGVGSMGSLYRSAHELIFVWKSGRAKHINNVKLGKFGRNRENVWRYPGIRSFRHSDEGDLLALHSTPKPVRMIADAILDVSKRGDLVLDAFMGSGTTIIAAERVGRRCYGCELDPAYVDTIMARFQRHSGEDAIHIPTGLTFQQVTAERRSIKAGEQNHVSQ